MVDIAIIGNGSHAKMIGNLFLSGTKTYARLVYSDKIVCLNVKKIIVGIGNKPTLKDSDLFKRKKTFNLNNVACLKVKSKNAIILGKIFNAVQVMPGAVINYGAMVRENTIINTAAVVEHDCDVGAHCHIAPNATLCGGVKVGELTHIGAGSVVLQGITIGSNCVVGAGSVVTKDMPNNTTWIGTKFHDRV